MALARINGPMLQANLERQGQNISIDAAAYFDVNNYRVGINKSAPAYTLDITGNAHLGNLYILGNTISTDPGYKLNLGNISNLQINGGATNYVIYTDGAGNLTFGNLDTLSGLEGFTANYITLGSNTVGALSSNAGSFTVNTTVTDSVATLNQILGNITNSAGSVIHVLGNISSGNINSGTITGAFYGNLYGNVTATGNISGTFVGNLYGNVTGNINGNVTGTVLTAYQPNITTVGTLNNLTVTANTVSGNVITNGLFYANGAAWNFGSTYGNANVAAYLPTYTGNLSPGNITSVFYGNVHADVITPYQTTVTIFNNTGAIGLPSGSNVQYPTSNVAGYLRYNNSISTLEFYNGSGWVAVTNSIADQTITPDGVNQNYNLIQTTTAAGILVSINGTVQRPGTAYTVSGTTITFTEVPLVTDIVDVRYIATAVSASLDYEIVDTGNVVVNLANTIIDSFSNTQYRSARYTISSTSPYDSQFSDILLVQYGATVVVNTTGNIRTGANSVTYSANINNGTVNLLALGTTALNQLRIQRTYFNI
jgi:hypothetical protein